MRPRYLPWVSAPTKPLFWAEKGLSGIDPEGTPVLAAITWKMSLLSE